MTNRETVGFTLNKLIEKNSSNIFVLDADVCNAIGTNFVKEKNTCNFIQCGICEQHMFNLACGLSLMNNVVFIGTLSIFVLRALEQLRNYICFGNMDIKIIGSHAGLTTGEDGATHQTLEDVAVLRAIPNISIFACSTNISIQKIIELSYDLKGPVYIRLSRNKVDEIYTQDSLFEKSKYNIFKARKKSNILILTHGIMLNTSFQIQKYMNNHYDKYIDVVDMYCLKPIDELLLINLLKEYDNIITIEDHFLIGGLNSIISNIISKYQMKLKITSFGVDDNFGYSAPAEELYKLYNLDVEYICHFLKKMLVS